MTTAEFWEHQLDAFRCLYEHARQTTPYYRERPHDYPVMPEGVTNVLDFLGVLPPLAKATVREHNSAFWAQPISVLTRFHTTSGTSGTPLKLAATVFERGFAQVVLDEWHYHLCGRRYPRSLILSGFMTPSGAGDDLAWSDTLTGDVYLSIYSLHEGNRDRILSIVNRTKPQQIYGYASAVHQFAVLVRDALVQSKAQRFAMVTSEVLQPQWRSLIEDRICQRVYNLYGSQEGCHLALQCSHGNMHINPLVGIVEVVDELNRPVQAGQMGRVLVTGLAKRSMPLIRYELGDMVISTGYQASCSCGLHWPTIGHVEGRAEDQVMTRDGRRVGMLGYHAFKDLGGVQEAQLVQKDYETFTCNLVLAAGAESLREHIEAKVCGELRRRLQCEVVVAFNYVAAIPRTGKNAKFKAVVVDFDTDSAL